MSLNETHKTKRRRKADSSIGMCTYKGYISEIFYNDQKERFYAKIFYIGLHMTGKSLEEFLENYKHTIDVYLDYCQRNRLKAKPPMIDPIADNYRFDALCRTGTYEELLASKSRIRGFRRSYAIYCREDFSEEQKKNLITKRQSNLIYGDPRAFKERIKIFEQMEGPEPKLYMEL